jgi:decaprenyl-phosphate phosphoribosyltransferase
VAVPQSLFLRSPARPSLAGHIQIARFDHWVKNVFVLPGIVVPLAMDPASLSAGLAWRILWGLISVSLVTSSNYVINEVMDAPFDSQHPIKSSRPVPSGRVSVPVALVEWFALMAAGLGFASLVSAFFVATMIALWLMGCVYNLPPLRTKDISYLDVLSEAVNNPLRMLAGWFISGTVLIPSTSLLLSYWMVGCYFMALKRYAEYRDLGNPTLAAAYRKSFGYYTQERLLSSVIFYSSAAMLFFGAFLMRYRLELLLAAPFIALVMAVYLNLSFKPDSAVQRPEGLYREPALMMAVAACLCVMMALFFVDIPKLHTLFNPTLPLGR